MRDNEDNVNKAAGGSAFRKELQSDLEQNMQKFNDPVVLGELVYRLLEERENTNRILKNILQKLDALESKGISAPAIQEDVREILLPKIDEDIMKYTKKSDKVTAEEVRARFKYKGKNAASARLNKLVGLGLLQKKQVGKKVFFFPT
ncbi:MAG: hypothetical protein ABII71_01760 [Candidatus Micrarchaeota archaeon]